MNKILYVMTLVVALVIVGCGRDDDNNNNNNDPWMNGGFNNFGPGGVGLGNYQWQVRGNREVCVDMRNGRVVNDRYCNATGGFGPGFGGGFGYGCGGGYSYSGCGGAGMWDYSMVSGFGTNVCMPGYTPIPMYGFTNQVMCVQSAFIPYLYSNYGTPYSFGAGSMYGGYQAVGCFPGMTSGCNCRPVGAGFSVGAHFGPAYAGVSAGFCF